MVVSSSYGFIIKEWVYKKQDFGLRFNVFLRVLEFIVGVWYNTVISYDYDAFGKQKDDIDSFYRQQYGTAIDDNPFRYCGEYFDDETGLFYLRARYYAPDVQRFVAEGKEQLFENTTTYASGNLALKPAGQCVVEISKNIGKGTASSFVENGMTGFAADDAVNVYERNK